MNYFILTLIIIALILLFVINNNSTNEFTVKEYAVNTYLYILLGTTITAISIAVMHYSPAFTNYKSSYLSLFIGFVVLAILIYIMVVTSNKNKVTVNISWILFMVTIGFIIASYYKINKENTLNYVYFSLFLVTMTFLWWMMTQMDEVMKLNIPYTSAFLVGLSLLIFFGMKTYQTSRITKQHRWINFILLLFFSLFVIHDTQNMINRGNAIEKDLKAGIINKSDLLHIIDYPTQSATLFLGGVNLFRGTSNKY